MIAPLPAADKSVVPMTLVAVIFAQIDAPQSRLNGLDRNVETGTTHLRLSITSAEDPSHETKSSE